MESQPTSTPWDIFETQLFEAGAGLLDVALRASAARAAQSESQVLADLLHRADLAPRLVVSADADLLTMALWLRHRETGDAVARVFEITARAEVPSWSH